MNQYIHFSVFELKNGPVVHHSLDMLAPPSDRRTIAYKFIHVNSLKGTMYNLTTFRSPDPAKGAI